MEACIEFLVEDGYRISSITPYDPAVFGLGEKPRKSYRHALFPAAFKTVVAAGRSDRALGSLRPEATVEYGGELGDPELPIFLLDERELAVGVARSMNSA